jgi:hypothetical protein
MKKGGGLQDVCLKHNPSAAASIELSGSLMQKKIDCTHLFTPTPPGPTPHQHEGGMPAPRDVCSARRPWHLAASATGARAGAHFLA